MKLREAMVVGCMVSVLSGSVQAAPPLTPADARAQINTDSSLISGWLTDQFKVAIPFNSTAGNVVPDQLKIFGFEVGAEAVGSTSKVDTGAFHNLPTNIIDTNQINAFNRLPVPMVMGQAKIGLPFGLDAGVRIGGIPSTSHDDGTTHVDVTNSVLGLDLRKALIEEEMIHPFGLTLGLNFTRAKGHITATTPYTSSSPNLTFSSDAMGSARTDWDTKSVGAQLIMNKKILFLNPYIGAAANKNFGTVNTSIANSGSFTVNGIPESLDGTGGSGSATPNTWDLRGMAGIEFSILPFVRLGIGAEIASQGNLAASLGLRVQFR
jgi:hypothetical protein